MALVKVARTTTRKPTRLLPLLHYYFSPFPTQTQFSYPLSTSSKRTSFSSYSATDSSPDNPVQSQQPPFSKTHFQNHNFLPPEPSPNQYQYESSDFEDSEGEWLKPTTADVDYLLKILTQVNNLPSENEAMLVLEESGISPTEELVHTLLARLKNEYRLALLVFQWAGSRPGYSPPNLKVYHLMISILGKHQRFDLAWRLVKIMHQSSMVTARTLLIMIKRYAAANDARKAIKTFHAMEKFKIIADSAALYTLLRVLCKHKNVEEAEELLFLDKVLFPLETEGFNIVLNGWCNIVVDVGEAKRLWREMSNCCIVPDATSYTHMICCFSKVGNLFDSLRLYDEMKKKGWVPGLIVYNSIIHVLTRENCVTEAINLLRKIPEVGLKPDLATYNSIIYPLCKAQKLEEAYSLLDDMSEKGIIPTIETYHAFARVETMEGTLKLLRRMKEVECGPDTNTFLIIFDKFFRLGQPRNVLKMWVEMGKHDLVPESMHYLVMVSGLLSCGRHENAREFYDEMRTRGFSGDPKLEKLLKESAVIKKNWSGAQEKDNWVHISSFHPNHRASGMKIVRSGKNIRTNMAGRSENNVQADVSGQNKNQNRERATGRVTNHLKEK